MLYAKISPAATITNQITPFQSETISADYMTVLARPYGAGAQQVNFEVVFGVVTLNETNIPTSFQRLSNTSVTMTHVELANWGIDDSVVLHDIAVKIGTSATEYVTIEGNQPF